MLPIKVAARADWQIQEVGLWWLANRLKAPEAFKKELQRGFNLISQQAGIESESYEREAERRLQNSSQSNPIFPVSPRSYISR